jgi:predicted nucleic acid-binding protein
MKSLFLDSSALVKRYVDETGSLWLRSLVGASTGNRLAIASLTAVEVVSAITRRQRSGTISSADAALLVNAFRADLAAMYRVVDVSAPLIARAMSLAETHGLRGSDAIQMAAALEVYTDSLVLVLPFNLISADAELNAAAATEGLTVDDPNRHP